MPNQEPTRPHDGVTEAEPAATTTNHDEVPNERNSNGEKCVRASQLIYPLGGEEESDLYYPERVYHFSTCHSASNVFVVGEMQQASKMPKLYAWSLYTGSRRVMTPAAEDQQLRHFYASPGAGIVNSGVAVFVSNDQRIISLNSVRLNYAQGELTLVEELCKHTLVGHLQTWSSSRYEDSGVVLIVRDSLQLSVYICALPSQRVPQTVYKHRYSNEELGDFRLSTQPFIHNELAFFFEHRHGEFTGRLARIPLDDGGTLEISHVDVRPSGDFGSFKFPLDRIGQMPMKIKHVERDGTLWVLMETIVNEEEILLDRLANRLEALPRVGVRMGKLELDSLRWEEVVLTIDGDYDDLSLDVSSSGTVVLARKRSGNASTRPNQLDGFYLYREKPDTLQNLCLLALIRSCPQMRFDQPR